MSVVEFRKYLPYMVNIEKRDDIRRRSRLRSVNWAMVVCDRGYNLIYATWLPKRPTEKQVAAFTSNCDNVVHWDPDRGGRNWLYSDACIPDESAANWHAYGRRLRALAQLRCLYHRNWASRTELDYDKALAKW